MSVARLVHHENPEGRPTPLLLLASLRDIDPTIELVYFGERDWRLGAVRPTKIRWDGGQFILHQQQQIGARCNPKNVMLGHLLCQGFAQIAQYKDFGDPAAEVVDMQLNERCTILENFRRRQFNAETQREATFQAALAESGGATRKAKAQADYQNAITGSDVRSHFAREMRGRVTFGPGGMTGGRGKLLTAQGEPQPEFDQDKLTKVPRILGPEDAAMWLADAMAELEEMVDG